MHPVMLSAAERQPAVSGSRREPFLYMAPLKGITDARFRNVFCKYFSGIDASIAPFVNPQSVAVYPDKLVRDLLPENNGDLPLVPQLLNTEPVGFLALADRLHELGYREINWNLGCPVKMVASKKRGSGLLPFPDRIVDLLEAVLPKLEVKLSIKMRLGYEQVSESARLLPRLNEFDLSEIIIHTRLGTQLYRGSTLPEAFADCLALSRHCLVYNGDITSQPVFQELAAAFPGTHRWMLGRGLLANPFLAAEIKGDAPPQTERLQTLARFHDDLFGTMRQDLSGPGHLLGRMKALWVYFGGAFPGREKLVKKVIRAGSENRYLEAVDRVMSG
jgi:tRNA-dihydrouridine synthase